ncbi:MAG UNVERIFIED_CONTAM: hypothetical protein LVT10_09180 [Anaerolineae bacterium]
MFVIVTFYALALLIINLLNNLGTSGLTINFRALLRDYGTEVSEGPYPRADWSPALQAVPLVGEWLAQQPIFTPDTNFRALFTGFQNTLRVVWLSLVASTLLGVLLGWGCSRQIGSYATFPASMWKSSAIPLCWYNSSSSTVASSVCCPLVLMKRWC